MRRGKKTSQVTVQCASWLNVKENKTKQCPPPQLKQKKKKEHMSCVCSVLILAYFRYFFKFKFEMWWLSEAEKFFSRCHFYLFLSNPLIRNQEELSFKGRKKQQLTEDGWLQDKIL